MLPDTPADASLLPDSLAELAAIVGWPAALAIAAAFPGRSLDLPVDIGHPLWQSLIELIGDRAARRAHQVFGGRVLYVAACKALVLAERNRLIRAEVRELERTIATRRAVTLTAARWRVVERTIWRALSPAAEATSTPPTVTTLYQLPLL